MREALERIPRSIDWTQPAAQTDVLALFRRLVHQYVTGYYVGSNDRLAVYRDSECPAFVATEFKSMIDRMPERRDLLPELEAYLLG